MIDPDIRQIKDLDFSKREVYPSLNSYEIQSSSKLQMGECEKAIATQQEAATHHPAFLGSHLMLAGIYGELGREVDAVAQLAEVLKTSPNYSLEVARQTLPFKDRSQLDHFLAALRKAGLK